MNKFVEFYKKAMTDESVKEELTSILEGKEIDDANDAQLEKLVPIAKKLGLEITVAEAKEYLSSDTELSDEDLDAVAGGKDGGPKYRTQVCMDSSGNVIA